MKFRLAWMSAALLLTLGARAQEIPEMPQPQAEHEWLKQLVGKWEVTGEANMGPDMPPMKSEGIEVVRDLGFWVVAEGKAKAEEMPEVTTILTLGYDTAKGAYVGSWVGSCMSNMWTYTGTLDEEKKSLTLETEGPNPMDPTKVTKYREVMELISKKERRFTSYMQMDDGSWMKLVTMEYRRKK